MRIEKGDRMGKKNIWEKLKIKRSKDKPKLTYQSRWKNTKSKSGQISIVDLFNIERFKERSHLATVAGAAFMLLAAFIALVARDANIEVQSTVCAVIVAIAVMFKLHGMKSKEFIYNFIPGILIMAWIIIVIYYRKDLGDATYILLSGIISIFATYTFFFSMRE